VGKTRISQKLPGLLVVVLMNQDTTGQYPKRSLDDAHILVQHQMMDVRAVE
jgi:hypothetical protein